MTSLKCPVTVVLFCLASSTCLHADQLPIEVQTENTPDSLGRVHLYDLREDRVAEGSTLQFVGEYNAERKTLVFRDPPWVHVTWQGSREDNPGIQQAFEAQADRLPEGTRDGAVFRARGRILRNRPHLSYHERERRKLHHFNLRVVDLKEIPVTATPKTARRIFAEEIAKAETRLRGICSKHGLAYVGPQDDSPSVSWYRGRIAVTDWITKKPGFSFSPIPYATASIVIDPASGKPEKLIVQRRIHRDPRD